MQGVTHARDRRLQDLPSREGTALSAGGGRASGSRWVPPQRDQNGAGTYSSRRDDDEKGEWVRNHGHILWMGTIKAEWTEGTIMGFFESHGSNVTVSKVKRATYCFVLFETAQLANDFMDAYNNHPLPGNHEGNETFNLRPRTRPQWLQQTGGGREGNFHPKSKNTVRDGAGTRFIGDQWGIGGTSGSKHDRGGEPWGHRHGVQVGESRLASSLESNPINRNAFGHTGNQARGLRSRSPQWRSRSNGRSDSRSRSRSREGGRCSLPASCQNGSERLSHAREFRTSEMGESGDNKGYLGEGSNTRLSTVATHTKDHAYASRNVMGSAGAKGEATAGQPCVFKCEGTGVGPDAYKTSSIRRIDRAPAFDTSENLNDRVGADRDKSYSYYGRAAACGEVNSARRSGKEVSDRKRETKRRTDEMRLAQDGMAVDRLKNVSKPQPSHPLRPGMGGRDEVASHERVKCSASFNTASECDRGRGAHEQHKNPARNSRRIRMHTLDRGFGTVMTESADLESDRVSAHGGVHEHTALDATGAKCKLNDRVTIQETNGRQKTMNDNAVTLMMPAADRGNTADVMHPASDEPAGRLGSGGAENRVADGVGGAIKTIKADCLTETTETTHTATDGARNTKRRAPGTCGDHSQLGHQKRIRTPNTSSSPVLPRRTTPATQAATGQHKKIQREVPPSEKNRTGEDKHACVPGKPKVGAAMPSSSVTESLTPIPESFAADQERVTQSLPGKTAIRQGQPTPFTLGQVMDHYMARRRSLEVGDASSVAKGHVSPSHDRIGTQSGGNMARRGLDQRVEGDAGRPPPPQKTQPRPSTVVAAAWANGDILSLSTFVAPHMRLVAPVYASDPEGLAVALRTAAAVVAGASVTAIPGHRLEVVAMCPEGLLLELCPHVHKDAFLRDDQEVPQEPSAYARLLHSAFRHLVSLDLEIDAVRIPHVEASDLLPPESSSVQLLEWANRGTATVLRLEGEGGEGRAREAVDPIAEQAGQFLGLDFDMGPLLPKTGLLECFYVNIYGVQLPIRTKTVVSERRKKQLPNVHLMLSLSPLTDDQWASRGAPTAQTNTISPAIGTVGSPSRHATLRCSPLTCTATGQPWRDVTDLKCVGSLNRMALHAREELKGKTLLAEALHATQIEELAVRVVASGAMLVIIAGRQGSKEEVVTAQLCTALAIKGKTPATVDASNYVNQAASTTQAPGTLNTPAGVATTSPPQHCDAAALAHDLAGFLGKARAGIESPGLSTSDTIGENGATTGASCHWCDVVLVHGSEALDPDLLHPEGFALGPAGALSVFVHTTPQVCMDSLTPVSGANIRMLRLLAGGTSSKDITAARGLKVSPYRSDNACTVKFLQQWLVKEKREEQFSRSFREVADVYVNTALPYDLHVLKPLVEPLLRSVPPPARAGSDGSIDGGDGCRSSTYALARSNLRLLECCETLHTLPIPESSVLYDLFPHRCGWRS